MNVQHPRSDAQRPRLRQLVAASVLVISCLLSSCEDGLGSGRGRVISSDFTGAYPAGLISIAMAIGDIPFVVAPEFNVESYKVVYETVDAAGNTVQASGAVFLPEGDRRWPLLSIQHGTQTKRSNVASENPLLFGYEGIAAASGGYVVCIADYLGMGVSQGIHPYVHASSSSSAVIDFMRACRNLCRSRGVDLDGKLFLMGYSEGGYATLATQKEIETNHREEFPLTGVAAMAGSYDLAGTARQILESMNYGSPAFLAYFLTAYSEIYGWNALGEMFRSPYAEMMTTLFGGSLDLGQVNDQLPGTLGELLEPGFVSAYLNGQKPEMDAALNANTLLDWAPVSALRLYHGDADEVVPYQNAVKALDSFSSRGADHVELVTVVGGTHSSSIIPCLEGAFSWFKSLR